MIFTAGQLVAHLWGDYILQSDWMATKKTKDLRVAMVHAIAYMLPFAIFLRPSTPAFTVMLFTHAFIDRYRLARYVVWAKNWIGPVQRFAYLTVMSASGQTKDNRWIPEGDLTLSEPNFIVGLWKRMPFDACKATGYPPNRPEWLSVWLLILADNILHITINGLAMRYL